VALDATLAGRTRRAYFERRLADARRDPERHLQFGIEQGAALVGFVLGRVLLGEFGRSEPVVRLEAIAVSSAQQGRGLGRALLDALGAAARERGIGELRTAAVWREHAMLRFLAATGWRLGRHVVLEAHVGEGECGGPREAPVARPTRAGDPNDWSAPAANDYEPLARDLVEVRSLARADLDGLVRIDRRLTGRDRSTYLEQALTEALTTSGVRVSLAAVCDGALAGFVMARVDLGDYGRVEPVAVLDTIGVDPLRARQGIGRALLSQLFANLGALGVQRVETVVALDALTLLGFFARLGFAPAERLAFVRPLG